MIKKASSVNYNIVVVFSEEVLIYFDKFNYKGNNTLKAAVDHSTYKFLHSNDYSQICNIKQTDIIIILLL
jgi:hypothetical protein